MTETDKIFEKWTGWIDTIHKDVTDLVIGRHIFWEVQAIIKGNPKIRKPSSFYGWLGMTFTAWGSMVVRRQLDNDSPSLKKLLSEMVIKPEVLSRERYVTAYATTLMGPSERTVRDTSADSHMQGGAYALGRAEAEQIANRSFDVLAGLGGPHVPGSRIERDISQLREVGERVKVFADKRIAHLVDLQPTSVPTFDDLDGCVKLLEKFVLKYELILKRSAPESLLPTWQYNWKAIFYEPWIPRP
jgi:hypothetical protein